MPNHITSRLKIMGDATKVAEVFNFIKADEPDKDGNFRLFDLEKIVPMPKALDIDSSSVGEDGMKYLVAMAGDILERRTILFTINDGAPYVNTIEASIYVKRPENPDGYEEI